jgi:hypothetical protein
VIVNSISGCTLGHAGCFNVDSIAEVDKGEESLLTGLQKSGAIFVA